MKKIFYLLGLLFVSLHVAFAQTKPKSSPTKIGSAIIKKDSMIQKKDSAIVPAKRVLTKDEAELKNTKKVAEKDTSNLSYAEEYRQGAVQFSWGLRGGVGFGQMNLTEINPVQVAANGLPILDANNKLVKDQLTNNTQSVLGYSAGLFVRMTRGSFFFQPEVLYAVKGGSFDVTKTNGNITRIDTKISAVDVPILFGLRFRQARIFAGPVISFPLTTDANLENAIKVYTNKDFKSELLSRPIVNLHAGLSFEFTNHIILDARYEAGLSDVVNYGIGTTSNPSTFTFKTSAIHLSIGYLIK